MKKKVLLFVMERLVDLASPDMLKEFADTVLDYFEEKIEASETDFDDKFAGTFIKLVRDAFDIADNDE